MKFYNENKTQELNENEIDFERGYLKDDKLFVTYHEAIEGKTAEQIAQELIAQGVVCNLRFDGNWYRRIAVYDNGGSDEEQIFPRQAKEAYDEYEDIQVYVPYTEQELKERLDKKQHEELKAELIKVMEDIEQEQLGIMRSDYSTKKARAAEIINELRVLESKEPRTIKTE